MSEGPTLPTIQNVRIVGVTPLAFTNTLPLCVQSFVSLHGFQPPTFPGIWKPDGFPTEEEFKSAVLKDVPSLAEGLLKREADRFVATEECASVRRDLKPGDCHLLKHGYCSSKLCLHAPNMPLFQFEGHVHECSMLECGFVVEDDEEMTQ